MKVSIKTTFCKYQAVLIDFKRPVHFGNILYLGNIYKWARNNLDEPANNSLVDMPKWSKKTREGFCQDDLLLIPFDRHGPDALTFDDAITFCKALGGNMSMPKSPEEEKVRYDFFVNDIPENLNGWRHFWYPVTDSKGGSWFNILTGEEPKYTNWDTREPNGGIAENCTVFLMNAKPSSSSKGYSWSDFACNMEMGYVCEIMNNIRLELLGLCAKSVFDKEYAGSSILNGRRAFQGKYEFQLKWDDEKDFWAIRSDNKPDVYAFYNHSSNYPLGV